MANDIDFSRLLGFSQVCASTDMRDAAVDAKLGAKVGGEMRDFDLRGDAFSAKLGAKAGGETTDLFRGDAFGAKLGSKVGGEVD